MTTNELEKEIEKLAYDNPSFSADLLRILLEGSVKVAHKRRGKWVQEKISRALEEENLRKGLIKLAFEFPEHRAELLQALRGSK